MNHKPACQEHKPEPQGQTRESHMVRPDSAGANTPAIPWLEYLSVKETAELLGVSTRSVYGYMEKGKLPYTYEGNLFVIEAGAVRQFQRPVSGRPRVRQPEWHRSSSNNTQILTHVSVTVREGQRQALKKRLEQIHTSNQHRLPGTIARYIAYEPGKPLRVKMVLVWRKAAMPPKEELLQILNALWYDLRDVLDWDTAVIQECEVLLHT